MKLIKHGRLEVLNKYPFNIDRIEIRRLPSPEFKIVPRKQKAAPLLEPHVCHSPGPGPQHSLATLATSGPGVTVSCLRGAGLSLSFSAVSGAVSVGSVPRPLVLSHNQGPGKRRHPDIPLSAATKDTAQHSFGDNSPALHSNKRKCCSINSGGGDNWD